MSYVTYSETRGVVKISGITKQPLKSWSYPLCSVVSTENLLDPEDPGSHDIFQPPNVQKVVYPGGRITFRHGDDEFFRVDAFS